jgi:excisionase family DNA binding protein
MSTRNRKPLSPDELRRRIVITVQEYAVTFSANERTVHRAMRDGQIPALQIGTTWRIPVAPLLQQCGLASEDSEAAGGARGISPRHPPPSDRSCSDDIAG